MLDGDLAENFHDRHPYLRVFGKTVSLTCPVSVGIVLGFHGITAFKFLPYLFSPGSTGEGRKPRGVQNNPLSVNSTEIAALLLGDPTRAGNSRAGAGRSGSSTWPSPDVPSRVKCCRRRCLWEVRGMPSSPSSPSMGRGQAGGCPRA